MISASNTTTSAGSRPALETIYDEETGAPVSRRFVCEEECEGFDDQEITTTYDDLGRPSEYEDADGNVSGVAYDLLRRPAAASDGKGTQVAEIHCDDQEAIKP